MRHRHTTRYDDHTREAGGVMGIGMSLEEQERERMANLRTTTLIIVGALAGLSILAWATLHVIYRFL